MLLPCTVFAKSGSVNYSWGADALASMHDYVVTMMLYILRLSHLRNHECKTTNKVQLKQEKHV